MKASKRTVTRRSFVGTLAGAGTAAAAGAQIPEKRPEFTGPLTTEKLPDKVTASKPNGLNLIVIICDTFRWDYLRFNGKNARIQTPNLDALAAEGVYFENCYADGLPTIPARRVMHTGRSILPEKTKWVPLPPNDVTFAEILGKAGFTTGFIVDTFHYFKPDMNLHKGFNSWEWIRGQESDPYMSGPRHSVRPEDHAPAYLLTDY